MPWPRNPGRLRAIHYGPDIMRSASALARVSASRSPSAFACASADCRKVWKPSITCSSESVSEVLVATGMGVEGDEVGSKKSFLILSSNTHRSGYGGTALFSVAVYVRSLHKRPLKHVTMVPCARLCTRAREAIAGFAATQGFKNNRFVCFLVGGTMMNTAGAI
jgi:hypothetical protein